MHIKGKTAIITGAAGNLGSAITNALLAAGASVIALDKDQEKLAALGSNVTPVGCDITQFSEAQKAVQAAYQKHPSIEILVNAAGLLYSAPLVSMLEKSEDYLATAAEAWQRCLDINLSSVFYVSGLVAHRMMKARTKGVIVNISSVTAAGNGGQSAYSAAKAGVNALTGVWAKELGPLGIRAVAVAPGYIDTPSTRSAVSEAGLKDITQRVPLKKLGEPEAIVQAVRFAIENDYVNGTVLEVDGGLVV